ncbi:MAG TPA: cysteine desulfurase-like protein [Clostridia bacterium]|nr:cysteine desulfurase-like protein [Clostridia bacterium]
MSVSQTLPTSNLQRHIEWIREQFPALLLEVGGRSATYFDGPGGTQVPRRVIDAIADYLTRSNCNVHGGFETSRRTDFTIASARSAMADMLGCEAEEIVFGPNMTTLTFAISRAIGRELGPGDEIVVTTLDHDANVAPWRALAERGCVIRQATVNVADCTLDLDDLRSKITPKTKLLAIGYASNAVGTINPVSEIVRMAHQAGAVVYVDAVHYAPHGVIDVKALDCDFLACSVYKFYGPHAGVLYGKRAHFEHFSPYKVRPSSNHSPERWETGTLNHEALAGVSAAIAYLAELGGRIDISAQTRRDALIAAMTAIREHERCLAERMLRGLLQVPGLTVYGIQDFARFDHRTPTFAVRVNGHPPKELSEKLGERGIFTWEGNYYAVNLTERLELEDKGGMLRIGLAHYNTEQEVDRFLSELNRIVE